MSEKQRSSDALIETLTQLLAASPPEGARGFRKAHGEQLLRVYYRHISPADLEEHDPGDLLGALIAHWQLMRRRRPGQAKVRVYNPEQEEHGWRSKDTIVEIVADDMPFLVDSVSAALNRLGLAISLTIHPVFAVDRDDAGNLTGLHRVGDGDATATEAAIQMHIDRQPQEKLSELEGVVRHVVADVVATTSDWLAMKGRAESIRQQIGETATGTAGSDAAEARAFLDWMVGDHFLFIAACSYELTGADGCALSFVSDSGLGLLRDGAEARARADEWVSGLAVDLAEFHHDLVVTKANARSRVHRPAYMDCVAIKRRDAQGQVTGLECLIGLFSSSAYNTPPRQIPLLRSKVNAVYAGAQVSPGSHSGRAIANILDNFPRDALFQIRSDDLLNTTLGVLSLQERQRTRLFIVRDPFRRFYTCLVYLPRERYSREVRIAVQGILVEALGGTDVVFETQFSESILARINFVIRTPVGVEPGYDIGELEGRVLEVTTTWQDGLRSALLAQVDEAMAARYLADYGQGFPGGYREDYHPRIAVNDIQRIERVRGTGHLGVHLYQPIIDSGDQVHVRLYSLGRPVPLSQAIPVLENMGLRVFGEQPYRIRHPQGDIWIHDFATRRPAATGAISAETRERFVDTFLRVWDEKVDNDGFNGLVLRAGLSWKEALLFRAYSRYRHQVKVPYTQAYTISVLNRHPDVVQVLSRLFQHRFTPNRASVEAGDGQALLDTFESLLEGVESLDEDRILRSFLNLVQATLRTNFFQCDANGDSKHYLSFKLDPRGVSGMPLPLPMFEIYVFSAQMEGVHLRGGRVARGGLRWSDRMEDYRTEILGLVKAQMVKNTVIVPVGSKGGFVVKHASNSDTREERLEKGIACYRTLLRGMLDLTDNLVGDGVVPPPDVVRQDGDDPYLVIAADKGTATFSDIANQVSAEYGFWLGDAFASGGSAGYDHKVMGITARGGWESVKRNFRELGLDTQTTDFTVVGIGDMAGDVFGNGMLLSRHIRLVGAFNHQHIFLDPEPDAATSFAERERLFRLPRSSWADYDKALISAGGGIYSRSAKSIALTPEVQKLLGVKSDRLAPTDLIRALLKAKVDLLWNGGIGTYVKASYETHEQAHDKANDALRVDATELRCRVIGEGGNLGLTQLARVEFALHGGQVYTDAIDNSAGVDCSDHEVNIKILLDKIVANGDMTTKQRNSLLADMTDDVADLVLADNYAQTQAISIVVSEAPRRLYEHARFMDLQEQRGAFSRKLEGLPDKKTLTERLAMGKGLTKPEVAVLLAYSKMAYYEAIIGSDVPDDPFVADRLVRYFPTVLGERFGREIAEHRLRREIIATMITGTIADHVGPGIGFRVREEVDADIASVARAYLVVSDVFETDSLWQRVEALDNAVPAAVQTQMLATIGSFLECTLTSLLRAYKGRLDMQDLRDRFHDGVTELAGAMPGPLASPEKAEFDRRVKRLTAAGVPRDLAQSVSGLEPMSAALDIVDVARSTDAAIETTAWVYSALGHALELDWIRQQIDELGVQTHWHLLARTKLHAALDANQRDLAALVLCAGNGATLKARGIFTRWQRQNEDMLERYGQVIAELKGGNIFDFAILSLAVARVGELLPARAVAGGQ
ncbi:MAG: NAD-glutamate dehydrogenase [Gammaproteobacteria bacterium]|nr:NAD-glutamate dehydrogenase [Gammaproteobacteria bacterium]